MSNAVRYRVRRGRNPRVDKHDVVGVYPLIADQDAGGRTAASPIISMGALVSVDPQRPVKGGGRSAGDDAVSA